MLDWLIDPFAGGIMRRALAEVLVLALACGPLGVWVLLQRQAYAAESIAHGMLPGLVLALIAGVPLLLGAVGGVLVAAGAIAMAGRDSRLDPGVAVAVAIGALTGAGALLALARESPARLTELLFGDPLGIRAADLIASLALALVVLAVLAWSHRRMTLAAFDSVAGRSLGASPQFLRFLLLVLVGIFTVAAVGPLGTLLTLALLLAPAAAGLEMASSVTGAMGTAVVVAAASGVAGLLASHHLETAAGASIALAALSAWLLAGPLQRRFRHAIIAFGGARQL
jgi:ABC-type Mn2+/Zn2+ transport system permease subunit